MAQAELRAAKGKAKAKSAHLSSKEQELETILSSLSEERANVSVLTDALHVSQECTSQLQIENQDLKNRIDKYDRGFYYIFYFSF